MREDEGAEESSSTAEDKPLMDREKAQVRSQTNTANTAGADVIKFLQSKLCNSKILRILIASNQSSDSFQPMKTFKTLEWHNYSEKPSGSAIALFLNRATLNRSQSKHEAKHKSRK